VIMLALLAVLARINQQATTEKGLLQKIVFGVYLGWICIATIANVTTWLISLRLSIPFSVQVFSTLGILIVAAIVVGWVMKKLANPFLAIAVIWAFYGHGDIGFTFDLAIFDSANRPIRFTTSYAMKKQIKKENLPQKICLVCGRPFTWRKKWEKNWEEVRYCSERCRNTRGKTPR
jgi:hypothetical protein